jgi:hypothetical protein
MSNKVAVGHIPEKICYVFSDEVEKPIGCEWDIASWRDDDDISYVKEKVLPAFPTEEGHEKSLETAKAWAEQSWYGAKKAKVETVDNKPIKNVRLFSLEHRGEGGRAYKVLVDKYFVDLREDVMMDTLLNVGIKAGGILQGEYIWAKLGSQMKLVRVGSTLHTLILEFESKKAMKPIGKNDLVVGGVYQDRHKSKAIFIDWVNTSTFKSEDYRSNNKASFNFKTTPLKKAMLFFEFYSYEKLDKFDNKFTHEDNSSRFNIKKTHSYVEKIDQIELPKRIVETLRDRQVKRVKSCILNYSSKQWDSWTLQSEVIYKSDFLNMYRSSGDVMAPFDIKKYLLFI